MLTFLLIVIIAIVLWWGLGEHNAASLDRLKETGFTVDYTLQSTPQVVFDEDRKQLAFITLDKVLVYDYDQVLGWEWKTAEHPGWTEKGNAPEGHYLIFYLQDENQPTLRVGALSESNARQWRDRLNTILTNASTAR